MMIQRYGYSDQFGSLDNKYPEVGDSPFINHITLSPVDVLVHKISALPSPLKSPVRVICQLAPSNPEPLMRLVPFISHAAVSPVAVLSHSKSELPSPLRSSTATTRQFGSDRIV